MEMLTVKSSESPIIKHVCNENSESDKSECNTDTENTVFIIDSSNDSPKKKNTIRDFQLSYILGRGSYAKVVLANNIFTNKQYALKIIDKKFLEKEKKEYEVHIEKYMLSTLNHPFIIKLFSTFQDKKKLYFILEYCPNRDFSEFIRSRGKLSLELTRFYAAEIVSALEYLHRKGIYHRDIKPENMLLDEKMHIKICDFSTANIEGMRLDRKTMKFVKEGGGDDTYELTEELVGTPEYVSPEVLKGQNTLIGPQVDLWALGCIIFRCLHGQTPFKDKSHQLIFERITNLDYKMDDTLDDSAIDIISNLLVTEPMERLGANNISEIKSHRFFKGINWDNLTKTEPPIEVFDLNYNMNSFKIMQDHSSLSPMPRGSKSEKSLNILNEVTPFSININSVPLITQDTIIHEGIVNKKSPWFHYNTRLLRLYSTGRIEYSEPKSKVVKGTIHLNTQCEAVLVDEYKFDLVTKLRKYIFKANDKIAFIWVDKINTIVEGLKKLIK